MINDSLHTVSLRIAVTQIGVQEQPKNSNTGPQVNAYLRRVGLSPGFSWCMAFVYWVVDEAAQELGIINPLIRTGGVLRQYNETTLRKLPARSTAIKAGDIFIMDFGRGMGHTGFIEKIENGIIYTIEGNTNDDGSREGYEVARRKRPISSIKGIIQL